MARGDPGGGGLPPFFIEAIAAFTFVADAEEAVA
jgi:hypothetical protein